jgi:hypothetical protein
MAHLSPSMPTTRYTSENLSTLPLMKRNTKFVSVVVSAIASSTPITNPVGDWSMPLSTLFPWLKIDQGQH